MAYRTANIGTFIITRTYLSQNTEAVLETIGPMDITRFVNVVLDYMKVHVAHTLLISVSWFDISLLNSFHT